MITVNWVIAKKFDTSKLQMKKPPEFSTTEEMKINKSTSEEYSIYFYENDFANFSTESFYNLMKKAYDSILGKRKDDVDFDFYYGLTTQKAVDKALELERLIHIKKPTFSYFRKLPVEDFEIKEEVVNSPSRNDDKPDFLKDLEFSSPLNTDGEKKKRKKVSFPSSKLINKAKKSVKSHNIIISDSKKDINRDKEVIESFLKKFIPGKESWVKKYRKDVLDRWISTFVISPKKAKKIKKAHKTAMNLKKSKKDLAKTKSDLFYDITR